MSLVLDDDDYPPYAKDYALAAGRLAKELQLQLREDRRRQQRQDRLIVVTAGLVAGLAIGGLLVAYEVF